MGGSFAICISTTCDQVVSSASITYSDTSDVAECSQVNLVGVCASAAFDTYYYDGEAAMLQIGCGFMSGKWTTAGE
jgi:hypothetical protein